MLQPRVFPFSSVALALPFTRLVQPQEMSLTFPRNTLSRLIAGLLAFALAALAVWQLETFRAGIARSAVDAGPTPATLYRQPDSDGPLVVVAHGFAGSRQLMEAISLTLARAGYQALAFDFEGHGRNPVPMGGDVNAISGTTQRLIDETLRVVEAGRAATGWSGPVALVGHSMASDVIVRAGLAMGDTGPLAAISMYSEAVTPVAPRTLLIVTGAWEPGLRPVALEALQEVTPGAEEGDTARAGEVIRRAIVAPRVEHASVLFSPTTLTAVRDWFDAFYGRASDEPPARTGGWIALLMAAILGGGWALSGLIPASAAAPDPVPRRIFWTAALLPALAAPLLATQVELQVLPVLVADYLALHLAIMGLLQLGLLRWGGVWTGLPAPVAVVALLLFGLGVFGLALDRYAASFVPTGLRLAVMAAIAVGTVPFMLADAVLTEGGRARLWRRLALRAAFLGSLVLAMVLDFERLMFLFIILPVIVLFYLVFGLMGRWTALRTGPASAGLALGVILAWSLAASFPLFRP